MDAYYDKERMIEACESLNKAMSVLMVTADQAAEAFSQMNKYLPPPGDEDIERIRQNPSLSVISKIILINRIKRDQKRERNI